MAASSTSLGVSSRWSVTASCPKAIADQLGLLPVQRAEELPRWPKDESEQRLCLDKIREVVTPILDELDMYVSSEKLALRFSKSWFGQLPQSIIVVSRDLIFVNIRVFAGGGSNKHFDDLIPLGEKTRCIMASPIEKLEAEHKWFFKKTWCKSDLYQKLSDLKVSPHCYAVKVGNVHPGKSPSALIVEKLDCDAFTFVKTICPAMDPVERVLLKLLIFKDLIDRTAKMHENGIAHLDIKNDNLVLRIDSKQGFLIDPDFAVDFENLTLKTVFSAGTDQFRPPEIRKDPEELGGLIVSVLKEIKNALKVAPSYTWYGETFNGSEATFVRIAKKICFAYDVYSLGLSMVSFFHYNESRGINWNNMADFADKDLPTPLENAVLKVAQAMLTQDYQKRPTIFKVQKLYNEVVCSATHS